MKYQRRRKSHSSYLRHELKNAYTIGFTDFLSEWNWDLHLIFYFSEVTQYRPVTLDYAIRKIKSFLWSEKKQTFKRMGYAGFIIAVRKFTSHAHVVLTSDPNYPRRLADLSNKRLRHLESKWECGALLIKKVYDNRGICGYLACGRNINLEDPDSFDVQFFRQNLLGRLKPRIKADHSRIRRSDGGNVADQSRWKNRKNGCQTENSSRQAR